MGGFFFILVKKKTRKLRRTNLPQLCTFEILLSAVSQVPSHEVMLSVVLVLGHQSRLIIG